MGLLRLTSDKDGEILRIGKISDLAKALGVSERAFRDEFERLEKTPPSQYRAAMRINIAKQLLAESDLSCKLILISIGFTRAEVGARAFKRLVGMTMSEFRRRQISR